MTNLFSKILLRVKPASANTFSRYFNIGGRALLLFATLELGTAFAQAQKIVASLTLNTSVTSAVNSITNRVYISNYINGTVTVVDGSTNTVVATIASLDHPTDIAINEQTNTLYVLSYNPNGAITVIDGAKNSVITSVPLGIAGPRLLAVNTATNKMYVFGVDGNIAVINGSTNAIAAVTLVGDLPSSLIVNQTTNKVYAAYEGDDSDPHKPGGVAVIDGDTNSVTNLSLQLDVRGMALNPVTNKIYVSSQREDDKGNCLNGLISEIDATTSKVTTRIPALCPLDVAVNASTNKVYVVNSEYVSDPGPNLLEIDCKTYTTRTLDLSKEPSFVRSAHRTLLVNPVTNTVYLASTGSTASTPNVVTSLIAVDGATLNKTTLTLQPAYTGAVPSLVLNAMTNRLYLCALQDSTSSLTVIDAAANSSAVLGVGGEPVAVAVNSVTNRVYTAVRSVGTVMVSSGAKNRRIVTIPVAPNPVALAVNPATNLIYVASFNTGKLTVIDGETTSTTMVSVGSGPYSSGVPQAVAVNPVTNKIYLANYASNSVTVVDGATNATTAVPTGHGPFAVAINSITNKIYVANINDATLTVIDGVTNSPRSVNVGSGPIAVAVDDVRNKIFVADSGSDTLTVINGKTNATSSINVGRNPYAVAVNPLANVIYAVNRGDATVTIVDGATRLGRTVPAGTGANSIALNIVTNKAYITNTVNRTVTIIDGAIASLRSVPGSTSYVSKVRPAESVPGRFVIPYAVAVNSATNKVYVADKSGGLFTLNVDRNQTLPLKTTISGLSDSQTVSTENVFQTRNAAPRFDVEVTSTFAESTSYSGVPGAVNLAPTAVYYEVDGGNRWTTASMTKINGANSTSFTVQLTGQDVGAHTLYVYPVYGAAPSTYSDGSTESLGGNALQVGNLSAYAYQIDPVI